MTSLYFCNNITTFNNNIEIIIVSIMALCLTSFIILVVFIYYYNRGIFIGNHYTNYIQYHTTIPT